MPGEVASAFVRIRPNTTGFKAEAERGVRSGLGGVGKIIGGAFAAVGIEEGVKRVAQAAASQQEELSVVRQAVKTTNSAWVVHGHTVDEQLRHLAVRFGFTVSELAQGFTRIQVGTRDSGKSFSLLDSAMNVSRARHLGLAQSAVILTRASQGNDVSLRRLGIVIDKVSTAQDALKKRHDDAVAAGAKFSKEQQLQYKNALATAAGIDKQATKTKILSEIQARFGGQAANFARTAEGSSQRFHEAVNEFEVAVGNGLLPVLTQAAAGGTKFFKALADGGQVQAFAASTARELASAYRVVRDVAEALAPPVEAVARAVGDVAHFAGGGGIVAFAVGFKAVSVAIAADTAIRNRWASVVKAGTGAAAESATAEEAAAAATAGLTAALEANTAALAANAEAKGATTGATLTLTGANTALVASNEAVTATSIAAGTAIDVEVAGMSRLAVAGRGLFAIMGGWTTVAAVGIGLAAFGVYKLISANSALEDSNERLLASEQRLDDTLQRRADLASRLRQINEALPRDRLAVATAKVNEETAKNALLTTHAARGSNEFRQLQIGLLQAIQARRDAEKQLRGDIDARTKAQGASNFLDRRQAKEFENAAHRVRQLGKATQEEAVRAADAKSTKSRISLDSPQAIASRQAAISKAAGRIADQIDKDAEKQKNKTLRRNEELLASLTRQQGRAPTLRQARFFLANKDTSATAGGLRFALDAAVRTAEKHGSVGGRRIGRETAQGIAAGIKAGRGTIYDAVSAVLQGAIKHGRDSIKSHSPSQQAHDELGLPIAQGIAAGVQSLDIDELLARRLSFQKTSARLREKLKRVVPDGGHALGNVSVSDGRAYIAKYGRDTRIPLRPNIDKFLEGQIGHGVSRAGTQEIREFWTEHGRQFIALGRARAAEERATMKLLGKKTGQAYTQGVALGVGDKSNGIFDAVTQLLEGTIEAGRSAIGARSPSEAARTGIGHAISDGIALGILDRNGSVVKTLTNQLDDAIAAGGQAVRDAVTSAKQNLGSIASSLAGDVSRLFDAEKEKQQPGVGKPTGAQAQRLNALLARVHAGQADAQTIRLAQTLSDQAVARQAVKQQTTAATDNRGQVVTRKLSDLAELLNRGTIKSQAVFDRRLDSILKQAGASVGGIRRRLGIAAADEFEANVKGLRTQAHEILRSPHVPGTGLEPTIVRPLEVIRDQQRQIADAAANQRAQQLAEQKQQTAAAKTAARHLRNIDAKTKGAVSTADILRLIKQMEKHPDAAAKALDAAHHRTGS